MTPRLFFPTWAGAALAALALFGCESAPEEVRELEARSTEAIQNYHGNAEVAVEALLVAYREASRRELAWVAQADAEALLEVTEVPVLPEPGEDGRIDPAAVTRRQVAGIPRAAVEGLLTRYRGALDRIDAEAADFRAGWTEANAEYADAMELRRELYRWLSREGVQPEHIDAVGRALADAIERRGQP